MKKFILFFTLQLLCILSFGQNDKSVRAILKPALLGQEHLVNRVDTNELKVMSASRSMKYISDLPMFVYVVTHKEILQNGYFSLTDVLKSLPGVRVSQPGSGELGETFQFRGLPGNLYTKILINNIPIKPSVVAGMPIGSQLPIRQAERIEVMYGPASAVYGADAVTGVINIIIKEADKGTFVRGDIFGGNNEYGYINFTIGGKAGTNKNILNYCFYGSKSSSPILNIVNDYEDVYNPLSNLQKSGSKIDLGSGRIDPITIDESVIQGSGITVDDFISQYYGNNYKGTLTKPEIEELGTSSQVVGINLRYRDFGFTLTRMYRQTHSSIGLSPVLFRYNNPQNFWGEYIDQFALTFNHEWKKFSTSTYLSGISYNMDNNSSMGLTKIARDKSYLFSSSGDFLLEQLITFYPSDKIEVVGGISFFATAYLPLTNLMDVPLNPKKHNIFEGSDLPEDPVMGKFGFNPNVFGNASIFGQAYFVFNKFRVMGGFRYDENPKYKSFNPRLAVLYKLNSKTSINGSAGMAFKAPPASIAYRSWAYIPDDEPGNIKYLAIPNPGLKPELYKSLEFGVNTQLFNRFNVQMTLFGNKITNLITNKHVPINLGEYPLATAHNDSLWASTYVNSKKLESKLYGVQMNIFWNNILSRNRLSAEFGYSLTRQVEEMPKLENIMASFQIMPKHISYLRLKSQLHKNVNLNIDFNWVSKWLDLATPQEEEDLYNEMIAKADGYFTIDLTSNIRLGENLNVLIKIRNLLDEKYGGLTLSGSSYDLPYNPQLGFGIQFGLSYALN